MLSLTLKLVLALREDVELVALAGWTVDLLGVEVSPVLEAHGIAPRHGSWFAWLCLVGLLALVVSSLMRQGPRGMLRQSIEPIHTH